METISLNKRGVAIFILGAGASYDSGISTFRGETGVLQNPEEFLSLTSESTARDDVIKELKENCEGKTPGPTYTLIKELAKKYDFSCILTQNIDGLVRELGIPYIEMHGNKDGRIVLYGENIIFPPIADIWIKQHFADVFVIGTSMTIPYIRKIINKSKGKGGKVIHINPDETYNEPEQKRIIDLFTGHTIFKNVYKVKKGETFICKTAEDGLRDILSIF